MIQLNPASEDVHHGSASSTIGIQTELGEDLDVTSMRDGPPVPTLSTTTPSSATVLCGTMEAALSSTTLSPSSTPPPELLEHPQSLIATLQIEPEFFWDSVQFEVQGHLVKLPVNLFAQHSDKFLEECGGIDIGAKDRSSWSVSQATGQHGSDIPCIKLEGVEWEDFKSFLKALVPKSPFIETKPTLTESEWISVLKLSTRWYFNDLRKVAIDELSKVEMDPIQRVCLAKAYHVYDWLLEGYEELVEREDPITEEEGEKIGMGVALRLCGVALRRLRGLLGTRGVRRDIQHAFAEELQSVEALQERYATKNERLEEFERMQEKERARVEEEERERWKREREEKTEQRKLEDSVWEKEGERTKQHGKMSNLGKQKRKGKGERPKRELFAFEIEETNGEQREGGSDKDRPSTRSSSTVFELLPTEFKSDSREAEHDTEGPGDAVTVPAATEPTVTLSHNRWKPQNGSRAKLGEPRLSTSRPITSVGSNATVGQLGIARKRSKSGDHSSWSSWLQKTSGEA